MSTKKDHSKSAMEKTAKAQPTQKDTLKSVKNSGNKEDVIDSYEPMENLSDTSMSDYQAQLPANIEQVGIEDLVPQKHRQSERSKRGADREKTKKPAATIKTTPKAKAADSSCPKSCKTQQTYVKTLAAQPTQKTHKTPTAPEKTTPPPPPPVNADKTQAITKKSPAESKKAPEPKGAASVTAATSGKGAASTQKGATEKSVAESKGAATTQGPTTATSVAPNAKSVQPEKTQKTAASEQKQQSVAQENDSADPYIAAHPEVRVRKEKSCCVLL